ncbi:serine hydrolase domain-containing protein [Muriicola sp. Z0-33]|uniref:serine hydrolase domain-containing protein n=1 Tax=Muriicola sp. Z0-33 TaxID=2816957 RepID=UPI002238290A|nr:serine hydrolase domain-containing protein [Muriicola sp. Z0-33]MCW5518041.1 serine hydrolase [Muriicola sp. Z0-33]
MMNKFLGILTVLLTIINLGAQENKKDYKDAFQLVNVWLDAQKDFDQLPGISVAVIEDQEILWTAAFGASNKEESVEMKPSTLCSICSISKLFTAVAIMKLYDEGKLRLDDKVADLLPTYNLTQKFNESGPVTVRSLLTHSSGLPREADYPYWTGPDFPFPTKDQINEKLGGQETLYPASTYFQYSNLGLTLLGQIVEEVSGMPFEDYVQQNILQPLDLKDTRPTMPKELYGKQLAKGYSAINRKRERKQVELFDANGITPAAGFSSNVTDLANFASWQFRLRNQAATEILKPATLKYMQQVHWTNPNWKTTWGLGFVVFKGSNGNTWVGHGGSCPGYRSVLQLDLKSKMAYAVMINAGGTNPGSYSRGIQAIMDKVKKTSSKKEGAEESMEVNLTEYVGYFSNQPWWSEKYIGVWGDKLVSLSLPSRSPGESMTMYKHIEGDTFRRIRDNKELGETMEFKRNKDGQISAYITHTNEYKKIEAN